MEHVNSSLCGGFFGVDYCFIVKTLFIEVDEVRGGSSSPGGAVPSVMPHLAAFKACVVIGAWRRLSDAVSCHSPLLSPVVWGPRTAEVHGDGSVVKGWRGSGRIYWWCPISDRISIC